MIQLAHRTGQYKVIHAGKVYEGEIRGTNPLTGEPIVGEKISDEVAGYIAHFELVNGFQKSFYMTVDEIKEHAKKYSQSFGSASSPWARYFDAMATKTVLKKLIATWGILSVDMAMAMQADQSVVDKNSFTYVDNGGNSLDRNTIDIPAEEISDDDSYFVNEESGEVLFTEEKNNSEVIQNGND